jgi:hypothetical protein
MPPRSAKDHENQADVAGQTGQGIIYTPYAG